MHGETLKKHNSIYWWKTKTRQPVTFPYSWDISWAAAETQWWWL